MVQKKKKSIAAVYFMKHENSEIQISMSINKVLLEPNHLIH